LKLYNRHTPQRAIASMTPILALKEWQKKRPELFVKRVYDQAGLDSYRRGLTRIHSLDKTQRHTGLLAKKIRRARIARIIRKPYAIGAVHSQTDVLAGRFGSKAASTEGSQPAKIGHFGQRNENG
jgi:hypothetical protein